MQASTHILFVDDDEALQRAFMRTMDGQGFGIDTASDGPGALSLAERNSYAAVVTDFHMPGMSGFELIDELRQLQPDATFVLVSGHCSLDMALNAVNEYGTSFVLPKPWQPDELSSTVRRAVEASWERTTHRRVAAEMVRSSQRLEDRERRLREAIAKGRDNVATALLSSLNARDRDTQAACRRVAASARVLAEAVGVSGLDLIDVETGALLHDIGKVGVPDSILLKPGPLTKEEWEVMRQHPHIGHRIVEGLEGMANVAAIVLQHHERWDGKGYPAGLAGESICIGARILAIVDTLDAIMSDRPYRAAAPYSEAAAEILRHAGTQFDPNLVLAFMSVPEAVWLELRERLADERSQAAA